MAKQFIILSQIESMIGVPPINIDDDDDRIVWQSFMKYLMANDTGHPWDLMGFTIQIHSRDAYARYYYYGNVNLKRHGTVCWAEITRGDGRMTLIVAPNERYSAPVYEFRASTNGDEMISSLRLIARSLQS